VWGKNKFMVKKVFADVARGWIEKNPRGPLDGVIYGLFDRHYTGEIAIAYQNTRCGRIEFDIVKQSIKPPYAILRREIDKNADKNRLEFIVWRTHCDYNPAKLIEDHLNIGVLSATKNHSVGCSINYTSIPTFDVWGANETLKEKSNEFILAELEKVMDKYKVNTQMQLRTWLNRKHDANVLQKQSIEIQKQSLEKLTEANSIIAPFIKKVA
jgi:hypothetical protein